MLVELEKNPLTVQAIADLSNEDKSFERVGSLINWEIEKFPKEDHNVTIANFANTGLTINAVTFTEAVARFNNDVLKKHNKSYKGELRVLVQKSKEQNFKNCYFVYFYTGKQGTKRSLKDGSPDPEFMEKARFLITYDEQGNHGIALLSHDQEFKLTRQQEIDSLFAYSFLIGNKDIQDALADYANAKGYRFNKHGGHYFMWHSKSATEDLYKIKQIISSKYNQIFSIMPVFGASESDIEEVLRIVGRDFKDEIEYAERSIFELTIPEYGYQEHWKQFKGWAELGEIERLKKSPIATIKYGKGLIKRIESVHANSSSTEYQQLVEELLKDIKPIENRNLSRVKTIKERLKGAIAKLRVAEESKVVLKWYQKVLVQMREAESILKKMQDMLIDELLDIEF